MSQELPTSQRFAIARSEFIDAHNAADIAVRELLVCLQQPHEQLMSQNIDALAKLPASPRYSKQEKARIGALLIELKLFNSFRCDIVHSRMEVTSIAGISHAFFSNVQEKERYGRKGLFLTITELIEAKKALLHLAESLTIMRDLPLVKVVSA